MMFASKVQPDRFPYRVGRVRLAYEGTLGGDRTAYDPRPFDPTMNNEPNPILVEFRENIARREEHPYWGDTWDSTMEYLDFANDFPHLSNANPAHADHAARVLSRLARLYARGAALNADD